MENQEKINNKYNILRVAFEPFYIIRRTEEIIKEEENRLGESKAKGLVRAVSTGYDLVKLVVGSVAAYKLYDYFYN